MGLLGGGRGVARGLHGGSRGVARGLQECCNGVTTPCSYDVIMVIMIE